MPRRPSTKHLPRMPGRSDLRVLRLRAADLRHVTRLVSGTYRIEVPTRDRVAVGDAVMIEVTLGPMEDEIGFDGVVLAIEPDHAARRLRVRIEVAPVDAPRLAFLLDVLRGARRGVPRRYRRIPVDVPARWLHGIRPSHGVCRTLSPGGAFVETGAPVPVGTHLELELRDDPRRGPIVIPGTVVWAGRLGDHLGFGFRSDQRGGPAGARLADLLRAWERTVGPDLVTLGRLRS